jgi:hypothetical protein
MTGYIILIAFVVLVFLLFGAFLFGYTKGRKKEQDERKDEMIRKAESDRAFQIESENIKQEVLTNAEQKKAELSSGNGRDRFDAINDSLRNNKS